MRGRRRTSVAYATGLTPTLEMGVGALAAIGGGAYYIWRLSRQAAWAEIAALIEDRVDPQVQDAAAVIEAARGVVDAAARRPYMLVLAHL